MAQVAKVCPVCEKVFERIDESPIRRKQVAQVPSLPETFVNEAKRIVCVWVPQCARSCACIWVPCVCGRRDIAVLELSHDCAGTVEHIVDYSARECASVRYALP